ncbi:MAG: 50S ribosomal protein L13 [Candidatus Aenigmarchaeota archaeon]|nr:50S ribosomal protein L13 [Candidatus Aenigmarchaeota archaeon]
MDTVYYNAEKCIAGRLASAAAKELLKGRKVTIVNAEKAVISGDQAATIAHFREKTSRGDPYHGPFYPRMPDRMLRRMVRGMVPRGKPSGQAAFRRLQVYLAVPQEFEGKPFKSTKQIQEQAKAISLELLCRRLK